MGFHGRVISFARLASFMLSYCRLGPAKRVEFGVRFVYDILEGGGCNWDDFDVSGILQTNDNSQNRNCQL